MPRQSPTRRKSRLNNDQQQDVDPVFAQNLIRQESAQAFERAIGSSWQQVVEEEDPPNFDPSRTSWLRSPTPEEMVDVDRATRLYHPSEASSATPMERWATVSTANEPFALHASMAMTRLDVDVGSLETVPVRAIAAKTIAEEVEASRRQHGGAASSPSLAFRREEDSPTHRVPMLGRSMAGQKRRADGSDMEQGDSKRPRGG